MIKSPFWYLLIMRGSILLLLCVLMLLPSSWFGSGTEQPVGTLLVSTGWLALLATLYLGRGHNSLPSQRMLFGQILFDLLLLTMWLWFSGGASNAFVSLLLLPIALAAITLQGERLAILAIISLASYSLLLTQLPQHPHAHHQMQSHFIGMWVTFSISVGLLIMVVARVVTRLKEQDQKLLALREEQLRAEQILTLGTAATQVVHQFATPLNTLQFISEMLSENYPNDPLIKDLQPPLTQCTDHLQQFRTTAQLLQKKCETNITVKQLLETLMAQATLAHPEARLILNKPLPECWVKDDPALIPALLNLLNNALVATTKYQNSEIIIHSTQQADKVTITIRDHGAGIDTERLQQLGHQPVSSQSGLGVAILLTHATLERLGGQLSIRNHNEGGAEACVILPCLKQQAAETSCVAR